MNSLESPQWDDCVNSLESPQWGDSNEYTQLTFMLKKLKRYPYYASWPGAIINPHWLELPLSRTNFHGPKGVESLKFYCLYILPHTCLHKIVLTIIRNIKKTCPVNCKISMVYVLNLLLSTFNTAMNQFLFVVWPKCAVKNVHNYISPKLCFTPEKISKYTEIGDFVGIGQTSIQIPGWDINRFYLGEGVAGLVTH